jgi:hypothetical protein
MGLLDLVGAFLLGVVTGAAGLGLLLAFIRGGKKSSVN